MSAKLFPTNIFRTAIWTEEVKEPRVRGGSIVLGGGSTVRTKSKSRLEQKFIDEDCIAIWKPVEVVFVEEYCTKIEEEEEGVYDFREELRKL